MGRSVVDKNGLNRKCMFELDVSDGWMALAGKLMGYAGLGVVKQAYVDRIRQ